MRISEIKIVYAKINTLENVILQFTQLKRIYTLLKDFKDYFLLICEKVYPCAQIFTREIHLFHAHNLIRIGQQAENKSMALFNFLTKFMAFPLKMRQKL